MTEQELTALVERLQGMEPQDGEIPDAAIADVLHSTSQPVYQIVYDRGHGKGLAKGSGQKESVEARVTELETKLAAKEAELAELEGTAPEVEEIKARHRKAIADLQREHKEELEGLKSTARQREESRQHERLVSLLIEKGVRPVYARALSNDPEVRKRIRVTEDGSEVEVLQRGKDVPFAPSEAASSLELLADDLRKADVPDDMVVANGDRGAASRAGGGSSGGGFDFKAHQRKLEEQREQEAKQRQGPSGLEKLRGGRPVT